MPQTMLALLGMMLVAQFTLRQHREVLHGQMATIKTEVATIAASVAVERLERIVVMPFDEATREGIPLTSPSQLTPRAAFRADSPSDDADDFDGAAILVGRPVGSDTLWFDVRTMVSYADELNPAADAATQTKLKRVVAVVSSRNVAFADTLRLERLITCGSACTW
jgi:hypothetical protein